MDDMDLEEEILMEPDDVTQSRGFSVIEFIESYGWYILLSSLILYYFWTTKLSQIVETWRRIKEEREEDSKLKKDPDLYVSREAARQAAIERLQNNYNEQAVKMKILLEEKEEKKRQEYIARHTQLSHGRKLNEDYNPLMGKGGPSYRAPRHTCPGNSCGNR